MSNNSIKHSIRIEASPSTVWKVLTHPDKIFQYLGSNTTTDWQVGSTITWEGEMQGVRYQNKGKVLEHNADTILKFTYWSGMGGDKDEEKNYSIITYELKPISQKVTEFIYRRDNIPTPLEQQLFEAHLPVLLNEIRKIAEEFSEIN